MRPLEWVVVLSFIPFIVGLLAPMARQGSMLTLSALLPLAASVVQMAASGWRAQMIPLYVLALLVAVSRAPALLGRSGSVSQRWRVVASVMLTVAVLSGGIGAGWILPVIALPEPTGPYAVGIVDRELVDDARGRRLMASIWYPANEEGPAALLTKYPDQVMAGLGNFTGLPDLVFQHLRFISLAASEGVPALQRPAPFPVLIFSHGLTGMRLQNSSTLQELASWGYVVVAIDHTDAAAVTVFPDGEARFFDATTFGIPAGEVSAELYDERMFPVWVADQRFVYDTLEAWQRDDPLLAQKLDLTRIGSFGHSFGGATSLEVCRVDARCQAAVDMDGGLYGEMTTQEPVRPMMLMTSPRLEGDGEAVAEWEALLARATGPAYWLELPNSSHISFTISELLSPLLAPPGFNPPAGLATVDRYLRAFFDRYLLGEEMLPLGPSPETTDVIWHAAR